MALAAGSLDARCVTAVAVHGTGTPLGDPIELGALGSVLGSVDRAVPLVLAASKV